jgi:DNA mismatch endonuclease (patch repair protein)
MSRIKSRDTKPELIVRSLIHRLGYRFRLHRKDLPGTPDLVFPGRRSVIFVHGCYWHLHDCKFGQVKPATNASFWSAKREGNKLRDQKNEAALIAKGWRVLVIWECETKDLKLIEKRVKKFLESATPA